MSESAGRNPERRVRVTSPQTRIALARRHRPVQQLLPVIDESMDPASLAAARATFARQRRLALRTLGVLGALLFGLSGLLAALPVLDRLSVGQVPASWLLLMAASYPLLLVIAAGHVRCAERIEETGRTGDGPSGSPPSGEGLAVEGLAVEGPPGDRGRP